jgi:hypothetical protein
MVMPLLFNWRVDQEETAEPGVTQPSAAPEGQSSGLA